MKKILFAVAVAGFLTACDNSANTADEKKDSIDSVTKLQKESVDDATQDAKSNIDSTGEVKKDSVDSAHGNH